MRLARIVALAVVIGIGIFNLVQAVTHWTLSDAEAYWNAALRLRAGEPLYPLAGGIEGSDVYRYAPWFAWLAVPWTFLPQTVAGALWSVVLLGASGAACAPLARARAWTLLALFVPILVGISAVGNVHALLLAALMNGVERRSGPLWIALAASLKVFPVLLTVIYLGRREWWRAALTVALTVLLWAPALLYPLAGYPTDPGQATFLFAWPPVYAVAVSGALIAAFALARGRFGWLAGSTAVALSLPRFFVYDVSYMMLGALPATPTPTASLKSDDR